MIVKNRMISGKRWVSYRKKYILQAGSWLIAVHEYVTTNDMSGTMNNNSKRRKERKEQR